MVIAYKNINHFSWAILITELIGAKYNVILIIYNVVLNLQPMTNNWFQKFKKNIINNCIT